MRAPVTSILAWGDRHLPPLAIAEQAKAIEASGVVDELTLPDHLSNFIAPSLWTAENTPMATVMSDPDSLHDAFVMAGVAHMAAPSLGLSFATDAIRRGPAEISQTMLSVASMMEGRARFFFGAGEQKQCVSFGHKRTQGLSRQEDLLRTFDKLWRADGPINHSGNHFEMRNAWLGGAKRYRPEVWVMGTGPKQLNLAVQFCDGIASTAPAAWSTPELAATEIERIRGLVKSVGRDPADVKMGLVASILVHDDPAVIDAALDNPIARWIAAVVGRINPADWRKEGIEPTTPDGWTYFMKYAPYLTDPAFVDEVLAKTTREMAEKAVLHGTPEEIARHIGAYCDAGVDYVCLCDFTSVVLEPADAAQQLRRLISVCAHLKARDGAGTSQ
jgi:phthiodiolone/phenolphthiodiolone dimycocerosates ketoreductase